MLKKYFFILFSIFFVGCLKEPLNENELRLEGEWKFTDILDKNSGQYMSDDTYYHTLTIDEKGTYSVANKATGKNDEKGRIKNIKHIGWQYKFGIPYDIYSFTLKKNISFDKSYLKGDYVAKIEYHQKENIMILEGYFLYGDKNSQFRYRK